MAPPADSSGDRSGPPRPGGDERAPADGEGSRGSGAPRPDAAGEPASESSSGGGGSSVALILALLAGGLFLLVILSVVGAAVIGTFVLGVSSEDPGRIDAGVSWTVDEDDGRLTITYAEKRTSEYVEVEWATGVGDVAVGETTGEVVTDDGTARMRSAGSKLTLVDQSPSTDTEVHVTVTAHDTTGYRLLFEDTFTI